MIGNAGKATSETGPFHGIGPGSRTDLHPIERNWKREILSLFIFLILCYLLFFFRLGDRPLWDTDEGMHAATSKDMVLSGDWVTPTLNGEPFYDKPVLFNWLVALSFLVFGFTEFAARLPAALLGLGTVLATWFFGKRLFGAAVGLLGGVILATSLEFIILSKVVVHDIALVFFVCLILFLFYAGFSRERGRKACFVLAYASAGFAVLAKGPIGVLLPGLVIVLFLVLKGKPSFIREMISGWGILAFFAVAAPWYILISWKNQDYAGYFFIQQNLLNFLSSQEARHPRPFYYYFYLILGAFYPWSFFLPLALIRSVRGGLKKLNEGVLFLLIWFGAIFLFFSAASSKLAPYILPVFPAASLLVAILWRELLKSPTKGLRIGFLFSSLPLPVAFTSGLLYALIRPPVHLESRSGIALVHLDSLLLLLAGCATAAFILFLKGRHRAFFFTLAGMVVSSMLLFTLLIVPSIDPYRSTKGLAEQMDKLLPPGEKLVFYGDLGDSALFYTNRTAIVLQTPQQLMDYLASDKKVFFVIDGKRLDRLDNLKQMAYVVGKEGRKLLLSNRSPS